jgi:uncharacterized membrane protein YbhN (UPF0104 family)
MTAYSTVLAPVTTTAQAATRTVRRSWPWLRIVVAAAILMILVWRVGTGPFIDGIRMVDGWSLAAAVAIGAITTVCCAWRWSLVSRGLDVEMPLRQGIPAYYRSQFLNVTLPGGVVGDVHRAVRHGRDAGDVSGGVRAVAWERTAGQVVQLVLTIAVLLVLPSPVRSAMPVLAGVVGVLAIAAVLFGRLRTGGGTSRASRVLDVAGNDLRHGLLAKGSWPFIVLASAIVVAANTATFLLAAHTAGIAASSTALLPLALLVLLAMAMPLSIGGWGLREGAAAWAFGLAGLTAAAGITTAVVYGVLVLAATLPGAVVLIVAWLRRA